MEYWEDRNCSKRYNEIIDASHEVFLKMDRGDASLDEYQEALKAEEDALAKLAPGDFGLAEGDYFYDTTRYGSARLYRIKGGKVEAHDYNDWWIKTDYSLKHAMGLTRKGKWIRLREAPLGV